MTLAVRPRTMQASPRANAAIMQRLSILLFGLLAYAVFLPTFLYLVAFVGDLPSTALARWLPWLPAVVPHTIDAGRATGPVATALLVDASLILAFGLQHSVMARLGFKRWLSRHLPAAAERSVYVLLASAMLLLLFWQWRPLPGIAWSLAGEGWRALAWIAFGTGFGVVLLSTFLIDHFDLFGLRQAWTCFRGGVPRATRFVTPLFYRLVRHPLYLGFLLAFWSTPHMTHGHLLFAALMSAYVLLAIRLEERDLLHQLGDQYARYREQVPMLVPGLGRRGAGGRVVQG